MRLVACLALVAAAAVGQAAIAPLSEEPRVLRSETGETWLLGDVTIGSPADVARQPVPLDVSGDVAVDGTLHVWDGMAVASEREAGGLVAGGSLEVEGKSGAAPLPPRRFC